MRNSSKMITVKISIFFLILAGLFNNSSAYSQINVNVNIGSQCLWGPVGYDYVEYYYLPEIDVFYYVPTGEYIYWRANQQVFVTYLPATYHVNLYTTYKVIVNEPKPYLQHNTYIVKYAKYKHGGPKQVVIRDSNDQKYYVVKGHPKHNNSNVNANNNEHRESKNSGNDRNKSHDNSPQGKSNNQQREQPAKNQRSEPKQQQSQPRQQQSQPRQQQQQQQPQQQQQHQSQPHQQSQPSNKNSGSKGKGH